MIGIILAAGDGTRLKKSTGENSCKALQKIKGKHLIAFALDNLVSLNIKKAYIVIGKEGNLIKNAIGCNYKDIEISYVCQKEQKGLINALVQVLSNVECCEDALLQLADEIFINLKKESIKSAFANTEIDFYCGVTYEQDPQKIKNNFSVEADKDLSLIKCTEKPTVINNDIKGTGLCIFRSTVLKELKEIYNDTTNTPRDLCDYMNYLITREKKGFLLFVADKEFNINTSFDLEEIDNFFNL